MIILITSSLVCLAYANLICDGDFQNYSPSTPYAPTLRPSQTYYHGFIPQNQSCWYIKGGTTSELIEVKKIYNPPTSSTVVANLPKSRLPIAAHQLCQSVILQISKKYEMNFTVYSNQNENKSRTTLFLNSVSMAKIVTQDYDKSGNGHFNFHADRVENEICFVYESVENVNENSLGRIVSATAIDDVQLVEDTSQSTSKGSINNNTGTVQMGNISNVANTSQLNFSLLNDSSLNSSLVFNPIVDPSFNNGSANISTNAQSNSSSNTSNFSNESLYASANIQKQTFYQNVWIKKLVFEPQIQNNSVKFHTNYFPPFQIRNKLSRLIKVYLQDTPQILMKFQVIYLNNTALEVNVPNSVLYFNELRIQFPINITYENINIFYVLSQEKKSSDLNTMANVLKWVKVIGKTFLCSYFVFSLISFWNLLLMYNFLFVKLVPKFTHITLTVFSKIFYKSNSLVDQFQPLSRYLSQLQNSGIKYDRLPNQIDGQIWFGSLGFSDNFIVNNAQTLIIFVFLIIKLWIFSILNNMLAKKVHVRKISFKHRVNIFFIQVIVSSPQILISSTSDILNSGAVDFMSTMNSCLSIVSILIISIIIYSNFLLSQPCKNSMLIDRQLNEKTDKENIKLQFNTFQSYDYLYLFLLHLFIPIFVVARAGFLFFIIITPILAARFVSFLKKKHFFKGFQYFRLVTNQIGWGVYHFIFTSLWILEKLKISIEPQGQLSKYINICGNVVIVILIFVAIIEILDFIFSFPSKYIIPIKKTIKLFYQIQKSKIIDINIVRDQDLEGNKRIIKSLAHKNRNKKQKITLLQNQINKIISETITLQSSNIQFQDKTNIEYSQKPLQKKEKEKALNIIINRPKPKRLSHFKDQSRQ